MALPAAAQRTDDNAVTAAGDAFGVTVGFQTIGLYGPTNVRGFNPAQAENLRIEGLYYDQQITYSNPFLFSRSDIRVGIAAQSYSFPSPTGIVDYKLRIPGDTAARQRATDARSAQHATAEIDAQYPLVEDVLSAGISVAHWNNFDYNYARTSESQGFSLLLRIRPDAESEIVPFVGYTHNGEHQELPSVYANGLNPPPTFNEQQLVAQDWTSWGWNQLTAGVVGSSTLGSSLALDGWRVSLVGAEFAELQRPAARPDGRRHRGSHRRCHAAAAERARTPATCASRGCAVDGAHERELTFDVRGRTVERDYGGDSILSLGSVSIYHIESIPAPAARVLGTEPGRGPSDRGRHQLQRALDGRRHAEPRSAGDRVSRARSTCPGFAAQHGAHLAGAAGGEFHRRYRQARDDLRELHAGTRGLRQRADLGDQPRRAGAGHPDLAGGRWSAGRAAQRPGIAARRSSRCTRPTSTWMPQVYTGSSATSAAGESKDPQLCRLGTGSRSLPDSSCSAPRSTGRLQRWVAPVRSRWDRYRGRSTSTSTMRPSVGVVGPPACSGPRCPHAS